MFSARKKFASSPAKLKRLNSFIGKNICMRSAVARFVNKTAEEVVTLLQVLSVYLQY